MKPASWLDIRGHRRRIGYFPRIAFVLLLAIACFSTAGGACYAQSPAVARPLAVEGNGTPGSGSGASGFFDVGAVDRDKTPTIEHTFRVKNTSDHAVTITTISTSCLCTTASLSIASKPLAMPGTVNAGDTVDVDVVIATSALENGPSTRSAWILVQGSNDPQVMLNLQAEVTDSLQVTPAALDFGKVESGQSRTLRFTIKSSAGNVDTVLRPVLSTPNGDFLLAKLPGRRPVVTYALTFRPKKALGRVDNEIQVRTATEGVVRGRLAIHAQAVAAVTTAAVR